MSLCINPNCNHQNASNLLFCEHCGSELLLQGRYRATKILGKGGFGQTYEICSRDETKVLKVLINNSPKAVDLFKREAEVLSKINYPGIPKFDSYFSYQLKDSQASLHCLVMEKIEGLNLRQYIKQKGQPINSELALKWLKELLLILNEIHSQGILHRDIKPDNIILDPFGKLFLIDFGAVKEGEISEGTEIATKTQNVTETKTGTSIHSGGYTAREQINGQARIESDIYSLGCTFVYLLTGKEPNNKENYDSYNDKIDWQKNASKIAPQLAEVIDVTIAARASDRPNNCQIVLDKLSRKIETIKEPKQDSTSNNFENHNIKLENKAKKVFYDNKHSFDRQIEPTKKAFKSKLKNYIKPMFFWVFFITLSQGIIEGIGFGVLPNYLLDLTFFMHFSIEAFTWFFIGLSQWIILKQVVRPINYWIPLTLFLTILSYWSNYILFVLFLGWGHYGNIYLNLNLIQQLCFGCTQGLILSFGQWLYLNQKLEKIFLWIPINTFAVSFALLLRWGIMRNLFGDFTSFATYAHYGLSTGLIFSLISSIGLIKLIQSKNAKYI